MARPKVGKGIPVILDDGDEGELTRIMRLWRDGKWQKVYEIRLGPAHFTSRHSLEEFHFRDKVISIAALKRLEIWRLSHRR